MVNRVQGGQLGRKELSPAKEAAYVAVASALLIGAQYVLSFIAGVEIVTILFVSFVSVFGIRPGVECAVVFSLLRCLLFGFSPTTLVLYLVYFPLLATVFGGLRRMGKRTFERCSLPLVAAVNLFLLASAAACLAVVCTDVIKVSRLWKTTVTVLLWVLFAVFVALCLTFDGLAAAKKIFGRSAASAMRLLVLTAVAVLCTAVFTLLDDVITPLMLGYSRLTALTYFYASFTAMLPQCVCTAVTMITLFVPLTTALEQVVRS